MAHLLEWHLRLDLQPFLMSEDSVCLILTLRLTASLATFPSNEPFTQDVRGAATQTEKLGIHHAPRTGYMTFVHACCQCFTLKLRKMFLINIRL